ncbi:hypothetical protein [Amycolatopsis sp. NPDC051071]|uniref:hypothetical protein n=1 Tax=Amycolatopsis sp. NPDC051071 TaxID=3154637 RepID=UPI003446F2E8
MPNRIQIAPETQALACEHCGRETLRVARLVTDDGHVVGQTMLCTECNQRHRER